MLDSINADQQKCHFFQTNLKGQFTALLMLTFDEVLDCYLTQSIYILSFYYHILGKVEEESHRFPTPPRYNRKR